MGQTIYWQYEKPGPNQWRNFRADVIRIVNAKSDIVSAHEPKETEREKFSVYAFNTIPDEPLTIERKRTRFDCLKISRISDDLSSAMLAVLLAASVRFPGFDWKMDYRDERLIDKAMRTYYQFAVSPTVPAEFNDDFDVCKLQDIDDLEIGRRYRKFMQGHYLDNDSDRSYAMSDFIDQLVDDELIDGPLDNST